MSFTITCPNCHTVLGSGHNHENKLNLNLGGVECSPPQGQVASILEPKDVVNNQWVSSALKANKHEPTQ